MPFFTIGLNHDTAPLALREKVAFTPDKTVESLVKFKADMLARTKESDHTNNTNHELVILSTCNRTELYLNTEHLSVEHAVKWLAQTHALEPEEISQHIYHHANAAAIEHLMSVATGLDSLILGEPQILGQVKQSFMEAKRAGTVNSDFEKLFQTTFAVAKQVRTQTDIGASAVSVAYAAVQLTKQIFSSISKSKVLLVGAGETIELVAKHLKEADPQSITVANRTLSNAQALANPLGGDAITISQIPAHLSDADVVISSTASALPLIGKGMVESAIKARKYKPMLLLDLAVPRDVESEVAELDDAYLYTVDDLQDIIEQNIAQREQAAKQASALIRQKASEFAKRKEHAPHFDLIKQYREQSQMLRDTLTQKAQARIANGEPPESVLQELSYKLTQQMMHGPTKALQEAINHQQQDTLDIFADALNLQAKRAYKQQE
ncbi:glutamyl-tRNA reductase [Ningiella sp. W23]|uniref:glutamyl-tRNA reductase n=1 Tax=Ningiella sp. W23 TaxID=3023715 RepID=UPI00375778E3